MCPSSRRGAPAGSLGGPATEPVDLWLFSPLDALPEEWRDRAVQVAFVRVLPDEARRFLHRESPDPDDDDRLMSLIAQGKSAAAIAQDLGITPRTVHNRVAKLRRRFDVQTNAQLAALLARRGF